MQPSAALTEMMLADSERPEPPPPRPAERVQPLIRPAIPPPEWRDEERERAERDRQSAAGVVEIEPPASFQARPAGKAAKSKTPNLDQVREWLGGKP